MILLTDEEILYYHSGEHFADAVAMDNACGPRIPHLSEKERELCVAGRNIAEAQIKKTLISVGKESKRMDGTIYLVPDYVEYRKALKEVGLE